MVATADARPTPAEIEAALPRFVGVISQTPPTFSAIRIAGERAYDLARDGETFEIAPRAVVIHRFALVGAERDEARFEADCGKGAYVRALARDLGRTLGCHGHVVFLRRLRVGPFRADAATGLEAAEASAEARAAALLPVEAGLAELPRLAIDRNGAATLRRGQSCCCAATPPRRRAGLCELLRRAGRLRRDRGRLFRLDASLQPTALTALTSRPPERR